MTVKCPKCESDNTDAASFCSDCGTQLGSPEDIPVTKTLETTQEELTTGSTFAGRYQIIEELGKGGMGKVYKVLDNETKERIALKLIKPEIASDKKTIERFRNELITARKVSQKNVCRMYDLNREEDNYYITMEFVSGGDLKKLIRRTKRLDTGTAISIANQICTGLEEAHSLGIVHRDLKPSNIMIDDNGNAKIMDFGIARSLKEKGITGAGVMIGTPEYMSPEQVEGKKVDQRSDIYSLGVILYEMVTGRVPFEGDTALTIAVKHKAEEPKDPKEFNTQLSDDLSYIILRCLEKDNEKRFQSAGGVRSELKRIKEGIPAAERVVPEKRPITSKEITVTFGLKKILIPIFAVLVIAIVGLIIWSPWAQKESAAAPSEIPSVAVLPFEDLSPKQDQTYFCDGIAAELINRLQKIDKLRVPARASSFSFKGKELEIQEIGDKLKVESVLSGSLQKAENRLRITVELVKVSDGYAIWSEKYERNMEDIFDLQDEISLAIVDNLKIELLGEEKAELVTSHTQNPEAYNLFLRGRHFWNKRTAEDIRKAIDYFEQAIELDPNYALAYARLSDSYGLLPFYTAILPEEAFTKARSAVMKALDIDETFAEAHSALGFIKMYYDWDWEAAEAEFKRAVQTKPSYITVHHWYAEYLSCMGRHDEAIAQINRAVELDPLSPLINYIKAIRFYYARQFDMVIEQCQKTLELDPNFLLPYSILGRAYLQKGMHEEAITAFQKRGSKHYLDYAYVPASRRDEAFAILEEMKEQWKRGDIRANLIARVYNDLGEEDQTLEWLEKSFERREPQMVSIKGSPRYDNLHSNPRFKALLKRLKLD